MKGTRPLLLSALLVFSAGASAECASYGCANAYVETLYVRAQSGFFVGTSGTETLANCTPASGVFFLMPLDAANYKEVYATLLAAQLADKRVTIRINEGTDPCTIAYVSIDRQ